MTTLHCGHLRYLAYSSSLRTWGWSIKKWGILIFIQKNWISSISANTTHPLHLCISKHMKPVLVVSFTTRCDCLRPIQMTFFVGWCRPFRPRSCFVTAKEWCTCSYNWQVTRAYTGRTRRWNAGKYTHRFPIDILVSLYFTAALGGASSCPWDHFWCPREWQACPFYQSARPFRYPKSTQDNFFTGFRWTTNSYSLRA